MLHPVPNVLEICIRSRWFLETACITSVEVFLAIFWGDRQRIVAMRPVFLHHVRFFAKTDLIVPILLFVIGFAALKLV